MRNLFVTIAIVLGITFTMFANEEPKWNQYTVTVQVQDQNGNIKQLDIPYEATQFEDGDFRTHQVNKKTYTFKHADGTVVIVHNNKAVKYEVMNENTGKYYTEHQQYIYQLEVNK